MSLITHPFLGLAIADPAKAPLSQDNLPTHQEVQAAAQSLILSASGWRKIFASPSASNQYAAWDTEKSADNSLSGVVARADIVLAAGMALSFSSYMKETCKGRRPVILLGIDTRPTGPALADIFARVLIGQECIVRYLFIVPAPEIMAYAAETTVLPVESDFRADGFAYVSASHNPPGYNGLKFGVGGGVLTCEQIAPLIEQYKAFIANPDAAPIACAALQKADRHALASCYGEVARWKRHSQSAYMLFAHRVFTDEEDFERQEQFLTRISEACNTRPLGVVAELNGSSRTQSIDADWLSALGVRAEALHDEPGRFAHRIVPENESLSDCVEALNVAHRGDPAFILGYVPDCDGDRGNLVYFSETLQHAVPLEAQQGFALACLSELAYLNFRGEARPVAVVVNDATSMRIEAIAKVFGARVFRAETGEANVIACAQDLRENGWVVRIVGEGSNGGTITHPSRVRDPLSTLGSIIRLLRLQDPYTGRTCFDLWLKALGSHESYRKDYGLDDIIESLPQWSTTSAFEPFAALTIMANDKVALKRAYQNLFKERWPKLRQDLHTRYGITSWKAFASLGTRELDCSADFGNSNNGGVRILFYDDSNVPLAFFWMRASGTEPVFRMSVDICGGTPADEAWLRAIHTELIEQADHLVARTINIVG